MAHMVIIMHIHTNQIVFHILNVYETRSMNVEMTFKHSGDNLQKYYCLSLLGMRYIQLCM